MSRFLRWVSGAHTMRYLAHYHTSGEGHVYQGRYKSFSIREDEHFLTVCRYVERNGLRAGLARQAHGWRWGSLWRWFQKGNPSPPLLTAWPIPRAANWVAKVNEPLTEGELQDVRVSAVRGRPFGETEWAEKVAKRHGLGSTMRQRRRPQVRFLEEKANNKS